MARGMVKSHRILIIGPTSPPLGGTRVSFDLLKKDIDLSSLNATTIELNYFANRSLKIINEIYLIATILYHSVGKKVVMLNCDARRFTTLGTVLFIGKLFLDYKLVFRPFGADLDMLLAKKRWLKSLYLFLFSRVDLVFIQTRGLLSFYRENVAQNALLLPTTRPGVCGVSSRENDSCVKFYYVGLVSTKKGVDLIIEAAKLLLHDVSSGWELNIIGQIRDIKIEVIDNVNFLGEMQQQDLSRFVSTQDVLLFPSKYQGEGYPGSVIEALHVGAAVVVSNWRYLPELVENNGFVLESNKSQDIKNIMFKYIEDNNLLKKHKINSKNLSHKYDSNLWNELVVGEIIRLCVV